MVLGGIVIFVMVTGAVHCPSVLDVGGYICSMYPLTPASGRPQWLRVRQERGRSAPSPCDVGL